MLRSLLEFGGARELEVDEGSLLEVGALEALLGGLLIHGGEQVRVRETTVVRLSVLEAHGVLRCLPDLQRVLVRRRLSRRICLLTWLL